MKYTIHGFQQEKLIKANLNVEDAFLLRMIKDLYSSASMEFIEHEGDRYMWVNYTYLFEQVPIMGSKRNLMRKIEKYGSEFYILRILKHSRKGAKGNFSYICPTVKLDELQDFDLMTESHKGYDRNDIRVMTESHNKDSSIKDSSIKDNKQKNSASDDAQRFFEECWKLYPNKKGKGQIKPKTKMTAYKLGDEFIRCIERYKKLKPDWQQFQNGSTFWNSGYVDYLDEEVKQREECEQDPREAFFAALESRS